MLENFNSLVLYVRQLLQKWWLEMYRKRTWEAGNNSSNREVKRIPKIKMEGRKCNVDHRTTGRHSKPSPWDQGHEGHQKNVSNERKKLRIDYLICLAFSEKYSFL